tara:strand:- start:2041 stop:3933 length:1893 start_codon:yes stop_codon:yes gene_type:complete
MLSVLRFIFITIISFLLLNPFITTIEKKIQKPVLIIAQDISASVKDNISEKLEDIIHDFPDFDIYTLSFSNRVVDGLLKNNNGLKTNISRLLNEINVRFSNRKIAALILATDGIYNIGLNPLYNKNIDYPIYPVLIGDTLVKKDVSIIRVNCNNTSFLGSRLPIEVSITANESTGLQTQLTVWNNNKQLYSENIDINSNDFYKKVNIMLESSELGVQKYDVRLSHLDKEENIINNNYSVYIETLDAKYDILLINDITHPDISSYKNVINSNKYYNIDIVNSKDFNHNIENYQLIVLFGINNSKIFKKIKSSMIPLLVFDFHNYRTNDILNYPLVYYQEKSNMQEVFPILSKDFLKYTLSESASNLISSSPPLNTNSGTYSILEPMDIILEQNFSNNSVLKPVIALAKSERKIAFICAEGFWRWKLYDYMQNGSNDAFNEFFIRLTQFLLLQENKDRFQVKYINQFDQGEDIYFSASFFNESYQPITNHNINISIKNSKNVNFDFQFYKQFDSYYLNIGKLPVGEYSFISKVQGTNFLKKGSFSVKSVQLEQLEMTANKKLLFSLAERSKGALFFPNTIDELVLKINKNYSSGILYEVEKRSGIINIKWILLILLTLVSIEWFTRKFKGII